MKINISGRSHQNSATQRELGGSVKTSTILYKCGRGTGQQQTHIFSPEWSPLRTTHCICIKKIKMKTFLRFLSLSLTVSRKVGKYIFFSQLKNSVFCGSRYPDDCCRLRTLYTVQYLKTWIIRPKTFKNPCRPSGILSENTVWFS